MLEQFNRQMNHVKYPSEFEIQQKYGGFNDPIYEQDSEHVHSMNDKVSNASKPNSQIEDQYDFLQKVYLPSSNTGQNSHYYKSSMHPTDFSPQTGEKISNNDYKIGSGSGQTIFKPRISSQYPTQKSLE